MDTQDLAIAEQDAKVLAEQAGFNTEQHSTSMFTQISKFTCVTICVTCFIIHVHTVV